jgi:hypothetical protein
MQKLMDPRRLKEASDLYIEWKRLAELRREAGREDLVKSNPRMTIRVAFLTPFAVRVDRVEVLRLLDIDMNRTATALQNLGCEWPEQEAPRVVVSMPASPEGDE